jgi:hypothetical protein
MTAASLLRPCPCLDLTRTDIFHPGFQPADRPLGHYVKSRDADQVIPASAVQLPHDARKGSIPSPRCNTQSVEVTGASRFTVSPLTGMWIVRCDGLLLLRRNTSQSSTRCRPVLSSSSHESLEASETDRATGRRRSIPISGAQWGRPGEDSPKVPVHILPGGLAAHRWNLAIQATIDRRTTEDASEGCSALPVTGGVSRERRSCLHQWVGHSPPATKHVPPACRTQPRWSASCAWPTRRVSHRRNFAPLRLGIATARRSMSETLLTLTTSSSRCRIASACLTKG